MPNIIEVLTGETLKERRSEIERLRDAIATREAHANTLNDIVKQLRVEIGTLKETLAQQQESVASLEEAINVLGKPAPAPRKKTVEKPAEKPIAPKKSTKELPETPPDYLEVAHPWDE
ncbi:MAG: hypothetical protein HY645_04220 [Acidobacteria bacterium]|nr:hypothetical protein [Acidobacteriota bacterium]